MAVTVVRLARHDSPPEGEDWVLVERDSSGKFAPGSMIRHGGGATFYVPDAALEHEIEAAIETASSWASTHHIPTVYMREGFRPT